MTSADPAFEPFDHDSVPGKKFAIYTRPWGRPLLPSIHNWVDDAETRFRGIARHLSRRPGTRRPFHPFFGVVENVNINAVAFSHGDDSFVALFEGLYQVFWDFFQRLMSDPAALPRIGDPSASSPQPFARGGLPRSSAELDSGGNYYAPVPNCADRRNAAHYLRTMAIDFILAHEAYHIYHGHTRLVKSIAESHINKPAIPTPIPHIPPIVSRTLEMDADCCALQYVITQSYGLLRHYKDRPADFPTAQQPILKSLATDPSQWIDAIMLSVCSVFFMFDQEHWWLDHDLERRTHLPPPIRRQGALGLLIDLAHLDRLPHLDTTTVQKRSVQSQFTLAQCIGRMTESDPPYEAFKHGTSPTLRRLNQEVLDYWKTTLRSQLLPLAYTDRLPP